jgi:WD40 repeat protein
VEVLQKNIPGRTDSQIGIASSEKLVAWPGAPGEVVLFDEARDRRIGRLKGLSGPITTVAFSGTGRFAAASRAGGVAVWDPTSRVRVWVREDAHPSIVTGLAFVPGTDRLASAGKDGRIRFWSASDGRPGPVWSGHENWVNQIRFSPDGRWLLTASDDETARLWDMETGLPRLSLDASTQVTGIAFSEEPTRFWVGIDDTVHGLPTQLDALDLPVETLVADAEEKSGMRVAGFRLEPIAANELGAP